MRTGAFASPRGSADAYSVRGSGGGHGDGPAATDRASLRAIRLPASGSADKSPLREIDPSSLNAEQRAALAEFDAIADHVRGASDALGKLYRKPFVIAGYVTAPYPEARVETFVPWGYHRFPLGQDQYLCWEHRYLFRRNEYDCVYWNVPVRRTPRLVAPPATPPATPLAAPPVHVDVP